MPIVDKRQQVAAQPAETSLGGVGMEEPYRKDALVHPVECSSQQAPRHGHHHNEGQLREPLLVAELSHPVERQDAVFPSASACREGGANCQFLAVARK